jgi:quercetin dioxygenase-like cupin family protein
MPFKNITDIEPKEVIPGYRARTIHGATMTVVYWEVDADHSMPEHHHPHEQFANVLEGEFELTVAGETRRLKPGDVAHIPSNAPHSGRAITDCRLLDVFHPTRDDMK